MEQSPNQNQKYPSNSYNKSKPSYANFSKTGTDKEKDLVPIADGKIKKKTISQRLADAFLKTTGEDIKHYLLYDWFIPSIKSAGVAVLNMIFYGDGKDVRIKRSGGESRIGYSNYFKGSIYKQDSKESYAAQTPSHRPEIEFDTRNKAESVLAGMYDLIDHYNSASMKDLYRLSNLGDQATGPMGDVGWKSLSPETAKVVPLKDGRFLLKMPLVEELRK